MELRVRRRFRLHQIVDVICIFVYVVTLLLVFHKEITVVLPEMHAPGSFLWWATILISIFLLFNIVSNQVAAMIVDTNVDPNTMIIPENPLNGGWTLCISCGHFAPPTAHHCKRCRVCILKSDHHCHFIGYCVGHFNRRFYVMFVLYLFVGSLYAFIYNSVFMFSLHEDIYAHMMTLYKMACPVLMFVIDDYWVNDAIICFECSLIALLITTILITRNIWPLLRGGKRYMQGMHNQSNQGLLHNLEIFMGRRLHVAWLSPLITSHLPYNGVNWHKTKSNARTA